MSTRFATTIGLGSVERHPAGTSDLVTHREPSAGALLRTRGSLSLLAQVRGDDARLEQAARATLELIERQYYRDLSSGVGMALERALISANRHLYERRTRLGIPDRSRLGVVALVIRGREAHVARVGEMAAVLVRAGRMYELPPPGVAGEISRQRLERRVASSVGAVRDIEPYAWDGLLSADDRLALLNRHMARTVGAEGLKRALLSMPPAGAANHLGEAYLRAGGTAGAGILTAHVADLPMTAGTAPRRSHATEPVTEPPDEAQVAIVGPIGSALRRRAAPLWSLGRVLAKPLCSAIAAGTAFVPRGRRHAYPDGIRRTAERVQRRRRRVGLAGTVAIAGLVAVGGSVAALPSPGPRDAIPGALIARESIAHASELISTVEEQGSGADLVDRDPGRASALLAEAGLLLERATDAGVPRPQLAQLEGRLGRLLDALHRVTRISDVSVVADLAATFDDLQPHDMVAASDGSLWISDTGADRLIRVDPLDGSLAVAYQAGVPVDVGVVPAEPWLIATAATDVIVIDRNRAAWRIDLAERIPREMPLDGVARLSARTTLITALQHRPPLEIFTLYMVDPSTGEIRRWSPPPTIPVEFPGSPEPFLSAAPDRDPRDARDLLVDANGWLLHADTVTRVDFGSPLDQDQYSLDPPPDASVRPRLDYRSLDAASVGGRQLLFVYDAAGARIIAFGRADGAFVGQWLAPLSGAAAGAMADVRGLSVTSVADGPPVALLLTNDRVLRVVLE